MKEAVVYFPYGVLTAVVAILPVLILIDAGGTAFQVGLLAALTAFCNLVGGIFWPKYLKVTSKASVVVMGYLGLFLGLLMMQNPSLLFLATAVAVFFPQAIFYATITELKARTTALSGNLGRFYSFASVATAVGYVLGAAGTHFLDPLPFARVVAFLSLFSIPVVASTLSEESLGRLVSNGITEFRRMGSHLAGRNLRVVRFGFGLEKLPFLLTSSIFSICFGIVFSQRTNFVKTWRASNFIVYALLLMEVIISSMVYRLAGRADQKGLYIGHAFLILCLGSFLMAVHFLSLPWIVLAYIFGGIFWPFINVFYSSYGLGFSEELLGVNLSTRSTFYIVGSLLGGFLVENYGFLLAFAIGTAVALLAPLPFIAGSRIMGKNINAESQS